MPTGSLHRPYLDVTSHFPMRDAVRDRFFFFFFSAVVSAEVWPLSASAASTPGDPAVIRHANRQGKVRQGLPEYSQLYGVPEVPFRFSRDLRSFGSRHIFKRAT